MRRLPTGITGTVLASRLRERETDGIVRRVSYDEAPPRVEYSLTGDGRRLDAALEPLAAWGGGRIPEPSTVVAGRPGASGPARPT